MFRLIATTLVALAATGYVKPFDCSNGTTHRSKDLGHAGVLVEWCEDRNGVKEGPLRVLRKKDGRVEAEYTYRAGKKHGLARIYGENGLLEAEVSFINGEETEVKMSSNSLRRVVEEINSEARRAGKSWQITKISNSSAQFDITVQFPWWLFMPKESDVSKNLLSRPEICAMFNLSGISLDSVHARYLKVSGEPLVETTIKRGDCVSSR